MNTKRKRNNSRKAPKVMMGYGKIDVTEEQITAINQSAFSAFDIMIKAAPEDSLNYYLMRAKTNIMFDEALLFNSYRDDLKLDAD